MTIPDDSLLQLTSKNGMGRRQALKLLASAVAAAQASCTEAPGEETYPYAKLPPEMQPKDSELFATSMTMGGFATGLLVQSHQGRPTKVDGNPEHPMSLGATLAQHQASILDLYDPDRARAPSQGGLPASWEQIAAALSAREGKLWLVVPPTSSSVVERLIERIATERPDTHVVRPSLAPDHEAAYAGSRLAFGQTYEVQADFSRARVAGSCDADCLGRGPMALRWAREFGAGRSPDARRPENRLYSVEPTLTPTGVLADHRLRLRAGAVTAFAIAVADRLARAELPIPSLPRGLVQRAEGLLDDAHAKTLDTFARDLRAHREESLVVAGDRQPPACHALIHWINHALGNHGATLGMTKSPLRDARADHSLTDLARALRNDEVATLLILDVNLAHAASPDYQLEDLIGRAARSVYCGPYRDETAVLCQYHAPLSHYLEYWDDGRAYDGTYSVVQPLIRPIYDTRSPAHVLSLVTGDEAFSELAEVRESVRHQVGEQCLSESTWREVVSQGFIEGSAYAWQTPEPADFESLKKRLDESLVMLEPEHVELNVSASPSFADGRFSNNAWLLELPHPVTKQTWGNAAMLAPELAARLGVRDEQLVRVSVDDRAIVLPALTVPEQAPDAISIELGYGRQAQALSLARHVGANVQRLQGAEHAMIVPSVSLQARAVSQPLARTQQHFEPHERGIVYALGSRDAVEHERALKEHEHPPPSGLPPHRRDGPQWAMTIDTTLCSGCSACVVACQAENNVPVVGEQEVIKGREMHWLRIDLYRLSEGDQHHVVQQPMLCQHCEHAPCEYVCPVFATAHSPDGLNEMTYNRCIGTRFCSNNCPYKVRRFNWLSYNDPPDSTDLQHNPQVTVRGRGVMEKCTYCVQRIRSAEIEARMEERAIRPDEVITACQQACPTRAIQFGDLRYEHTAMVRWRRRPRAYAVFRHLGTRPRTEYLAKIRLPEPTLGDDDV